MFNSSLKKVLLVFLLLFLTLKACSITPPSSVREGQSNTFSVSGLSSIDSYNYFCSQSSSPSTLITSGTTGSFSCTFSGSSYWVSVNNTNSPSSDNCYASGAVSSSTSSLSVSITSPSSITSSSVSIVGSVQGVTSGSVTVTSGNSCFNPANGNINSSGGFSVSLSILKQSGSCNITVSASSGSSTGSFSTSIPINFQTQSVNNGCGSTGCNGFQLCYYTSGSATGSSNSCVYNTNCQYSSQCGYKPFCSLSVNASSVSSPGGAVLVTGVLNGLSSVPTGWSVQCGNDENSQGSCSSTLQSNGLYNGQCTAVCFYNSTSGGQQLQIHSTVNSVDCGEAFVTVNPLTVNYKPVCTVNIQPSSAQNGSVNVNVDYSGSGQSVSSASVDCGGGVLPSDIARLTCSSYYNGASWEGSCAGACFYNNSPVQVNIPLKVSLNGASCQTIFTLLPASVSQTVSKNVSITSVSSQVFSVNLSSNDIFFSESVIDPNKVLSVEGGFNSSAPVDFIACTPPSNAGACSCLVNGDSFNCNFQPQVNGEYVLTFKSGLNEYNSTLDLTAGSKPSIVIVSQGSNWFDALISLRVWLAGLLGSVWSFLKRII